MWPVWIAWHHGAKSTLLTERDGARRGALSAESFGYINVRQFERFTFIVAMCRTWESLSLVEHCSHAIRTPRDCGVTPGRNGRYFTACMLASRLLFHLRIEGLLMRWVRAVVAVGLVVGMLLALGSTSRGSGATLEPVTLAVLGVGLTLLTSRRSRTRA